MSIVLFSSYITHKQKYPSLYGSVFFMPYASRVTYQKPLRDADFYIFTSVHAATWAVSQMPRYTRAIFVVSGPSCAHTVRQYCPVADIRQNVKQGVEGVIEELQSVKGNGVWYRGEKVVNPSAFQNFSVQSDVIYRIQPWASYPELVGMIQAGGIDAICVESIQQAVALNRWLKYNRNLVLWAKSERIRDFLSEHGWSHAESKSEVISEIRKKLIC